VLRRVAASLGVQIATLGVSFADRFVLVGILLRAWGTDRYADWATLAAAAGLITLGELGLNVYFGNAWQNAHAEGDEKRFRRLIGLSLTAYAVIGASIAGLSLLFVALVDPGAVFSLKAMGRGEGQGALRVSIGAATTASDIELFQKALAGIASRRAGRNEAA